MSPSKPQWFAAYVRSRHEKKVADQLALREVERFLPLYKAERQWSDRKMMVMLPLFPGYVFVRLSAGERGRVLETPGVLYLVGAKTPEPLEDEEIGRLMMMTSGQHDARPHESVAIGDRVVVTHGPLQGIEGVLMREKGKSRVVVNVGTIHKAVSVEVDAGAVKRASHMQEKPHTFGAAGAERACRGLDAGGAGGELACAARASKGDPLSGDGVPGVSPPRPSLSSVGTPKRSISGF